MKVLLACTLLLALAVLANCEVCHHQNASNCTLTTCTTTGSKLACIESECTCVTFTACAQKSDCDTACSSAHGHGPGHHHTYHCLDGECKCGELDD